MDEVYHARLSATPYIPPNPPHLPNEGSTNTDIHIQPHPFPILNPSLNPQPNPNPIPIQLPNIYVSPYPPAAPSGPPIAMASTAAAPPANVPTTITKISSADKGGKIKIGPVSFTRPHPLLWISLAISIVALVLGVPKGALPTLTGRHRALQAQEKLVDEKLRLLSHLSHFLPPPLAALVHPDPAHPINPSAGIDWRNADLLRAGNLQFWNTYAGSRLLVDGTAGNGQERWWAVEELGEGASLVRSKGEGNEKEVWVLRMGENTLTHSLLLRDKLQHDLDKARAEHRHAVGTIQPAMADQAKHITVQRALGSSPANHADTEHDIREKQAEQEDRKRREKAREVEVDEREREVARREKWVIKEMRKMSDKVHAQATELTLEDRITERLKSYQRQLAHLHTHEQAGSSHEPSRTHAEA